jgi:hypothetical protein
MHEKLKRPKTMSSRDMLGGGLKFVGKELLRDNLPELGEEIGGLFGAGFADGLGAPEFMTVGAAAGSKLGKASGELAEKSINKLIDKL